MNHSTPGLPVHHQLLEFTQTHVHQVGDAIQASHPLSSHSPPAPNLSQHQGLFQWVNSSHEVAKVLFRFIDDLKKHEDFLNHILSFFAKYLFFIPHIYSLEYGCFGCWFVVSSVQVFCDPMDCSLPGSSIHEIPQARMLEWAAISFSGGLPNLCLLLGRYILHHWATWEAQNMENCSPYRTGLLYMGENLFGTFYSFIDVWSFYHYKTFNAAYSMTPSIAIKEICPPLLHFFMNTKVIVDEHYKCHQWYVSIMHRNLFSLCSKSDSGEHGFLSIHINQEH